MTHPKVVVTESRNRPRYELDISYYNLGLHHTTRGAVRVINTAARHFGTLSEAAEQVAKRNDLSLMQVIGVREPVLDYEPRGNYV